MKRILFPVVAVLATFISQPAQAQYMTVDVAGQVKQDLYDKAKGLNMLKDLGYSQYYLERAANQGMKALDACEVGEPAASCLEEYELFIQYRDDVLRNK